MSRRLMLIVLFVSDGDIKGRSCLPFDVNVAHFLAADADVVQEDVTGVPDDAAQEEPESHNAAHQMQKQKVSSRNASSSVFVLLCFAGCDVERGSGWSEGLGKQIHPHHQTALREQHRKTIRTHTHKHENTHAQMMLPALSQAAGGCTVVSSPHAQGPVP